MNQDKQSSTAQPDVLALVKDGMEVVDTTGDHIGKVDAVFLGDVADGDSVYGGPTSDRSAPAEALDTDVNIFAGLFVTDNDMPQEVRERLRYHGFMRIAPHGLFRSHRYAMREQVVAVTDDRVSISVPESKLIKA